MKLVNVARFLERPLFLEGEPGTGKTSLAYALASDLDLPIIHAQCKSTTTAQDLLYTVDVVQRLQDAQLGKDVSDVRQYVKLGPLGETFAKQEPAILLIDEIDKAKREFGNDLLHELDQMAFFIPETGQEIAAKFKPLVLISSNHEKDMSEPFKRRCVYGWIDFPTPQHMTEIVRAHVPKIGDQLLKSAIKRFYDIRGNEHLEKKPSTSEMIDWIKVLMKDGVDEMTDEIPYPGVLLKSKDDLDRITGSNTHKAEALREAEMPEAVIAAVEGKKVIKVKAKSQYDRNDPDPAVYLLLANESYSFTTSKNYGQRPFDIKADGVKRVDNLTFALDVSPNSQEAPYLYQALIDKGYIYSEFVATDEPIDFAEIDESNDLYMMGRTADGFTIYRTKDGKTVFEQLVGDGTENGPRRAQDNEADSYEEEDYLGSTIPPHKPQ